MKNIFKLLILTTIGMLLFSCDRDDRVILEKTTDSNLKADKSSVILNETTATSSAMTFTWKEPSFNTEVVKVNRVEFSKAGNNFSKSVTYDISSGENPVSITHLQMNTLMSNLGLTPDIESTVEVRLKTNVGSASYYSTPIKISVTPYTPNPDLIYPKINVPGSYAAAAGYADWNPANTANLFSPEKNTKYRGFIYVTNPNSEFKFTINQVWAGDKGDDNTFTGKLLETGEANCKAALAGTYYLKVDWIANTYSQEKADFGIIGDATPTGWTSDTKLVYNPSTKTYVINSIALSNSGVFKFRANNDWAMKILPEKADQTLDSGTPVQTFFNAEGTVTGDPSYKVSSAGNYKIELDLHNSAYYKLTVTKL